MGNKHIAQRFLWGLPFKNNILSTGFQWQWLTLLALAEGPGLLPRGASTCLCYQQWLVLDVSCTWHLLLITDPDCRYPAALAVTPLTSGIHIHALSMLSVTIYFKARKWLVNEGHRDLVEMAPWKVCTWSIPGWHFRKIPQWLVEGGVGVGLDTYPFLCRSSVILSKLILSIVPWVCVLKALAVLDFLLPWWWIHHRVDEFTGPLDLPTQLVFLTGAALINVFLRSSSSFALWMSLAVGLGNFHCQSGYPRIQDQRFIISLNLAQRRRTAPQAQVRSHYLAQPSPWKQPSGLATFSSFLSWN